jgi:sterol desaturase/sphingolipid hydroxylase (fatty acid hydroxylase superfamily)
MASEQQLQDITHTIQLAVAPVFLLSAIGTALGVFSTRLGRVVDRARVLETELLNATDENRPGLVEELRRLDQRVRLIHLALTTGTVAALLVCLLIAVAFVGYLSGVNLGAVVATLFIVAMLAFVGSLVFFLREIFVAIATLRFRYPAELVKPAPPPPAAP